MRRHSLLAALAFAGVAAASPVAAQSDVMRPVQELFDSFNKGDATTSAAGCAAVTSIIDDFPPHEWHGASACRQWMSAYNDYARTHGITDMIIRLTKPRHVDVTGDRAYVVVPANYTLTLRGKSIARDNSTITLTLKKSASGWRVIAWAWADG